MSAPILASSALSDLATVTGGPTAGSMPLSNLQTNQPSGADSTRLTDLSNAYFIFDFGVSVNPNLIYIGYATIARVCTATIRKRAANSPDPAAVTPGYDSGAVPFTSRADLAKLGYTRFPHIAYSAAGFGSHRYWRFDIDDPDNTLTYIDIGRAILASLTSPDGISPVTCYVFQRGTAAQGGSIGFDQPVVQQQTVGRQTYTAVRTPLDTQKFSIVSVTEADLLTTLSGMHRTRGNSRPVLWIMDPSNPAYIAQKTIYGLMTLSDHPYQGYVAGVGTTYNVDGSIMEMR